MDWRGPKTLYGRPGVTWQATYVIKYEAIATDSGLAEPNAVGVEVADSGIPRWRSTLRLTDEIGNITGMWTVRYISGLRESCGDAQGTAYCSDSAGGDTGTNQLSDVAYNDARISWKVPVSKNNLVLAAGVNNVFDQGSPMCESCSLNGYDASLYDLPGRYAYAEATWKF